MTFISPQKDLCWICYIGLPKQYKQQPPFGVTIMRRGGGGGGREEDNLQWTWFPSSGICNIFCHLVPQNLDKLQLDGLHGSGVELFKFCLSGKFFSPCVAILCMYVCNMQCMLLYTPLTPQWKLILHFCYFTELQKNFSCHSSEKKNSLKDSLVHLVSFITHFVY